MKSLYAAKNSSTIPCDCDDPIEGLRYMFCDMVQKGRVAKGQCPARRPVFLRTHGAIKGSINIFDDIPPELKQGIFANSGEHPVYVRYSSDLPDGRPDWKSTIGIGIKIFNIPDEKVLTDDGANTADLLLQNVPFFFVDNASDMCNFTKASLEGHGDEWIKEHSPKTKDLLDAMAKPILSVLETNLWSVVPFKLGANNYCKYILKPGLSVSPGKPDTTDPNFLAKDLQERMKASDISLDIYIQKRPDASEQGADYVEEHFPLDRATIVWDENEAKPIKVATIHLPQQDINDEQQERYGDWLAFNIGRVPEANAPVGSIAEVRMSVYQTSAEYRQETNSQPTTEPSVAGEPELPKVKCPFSGQPKPDTNTYSLSKEDIERITHVRIHPGIGVARVGDSSSYYIGPEVINPKPTDFGATRDSSGAIKKQAARFRVYGYDKNNKVVAEIQQSDQSSIEWAVHVANRKAAWYEFNAAMDIPATVKLTVLKRNAHVHGSDRNALAIDPGVCKIMGKNRSDDSFDMIGHFQNTPVKLGTLKTDDAGRLLVVPGSGISASPTNQPVYDPNRDNAFNNANGWYDDISDGPVYAKVMVGDKTFDADPAWVIAAPPNFAPDIAGWRTMNDLLRGVYIQSGMLPIPEEVSFSEHIQPILVRLSGLQWVNKGFAAMFGAGAPMNFEDTSLLEKLSKVPQGSNYPDPYVELRRTIYNSFRATNTRSVEWGAWPWIYGDAFGYTDPDPSQAPSPKTFLPLPIAFDYALSKWVNGEFINDYDPTVKYQVLEELDLQVQPDILDQAAMHFCLADAFHPGAELTWPMRHASMYRAPYRIRQRAEGKPDPMYGKELTNADILKIDGPLYEQGPGDLTRWMAIPWQGDTAFCRSGYDIEYDPYLPTFWPARVPNQVLTEANYNKVCDTSLSMDERIAAFNDRPSWLRQLPTHNPAPEQMQYMIDHFGDMGVLEARPKPDDIDWLPDLIYVENLSAKKKEELSEARMLLKSYGELSAFDRLLREAGWESAAHLKEFKDIKQRKK